MDGIVLHGGVHVNFGGDANVTVSKKAADKINILGLLIKKCAAGVAELVGRAGAADPRGARGAVSEK